MLTSHMLIHANPARSCLGARTEVTIWQHTVAEQVNGKTLGGVPTTAA